MFYKGLKVAAYVISTITPVILTHYLIKKYKRLLKECKPPEKGEYEFIFTTYKNHNCKPHLYKRLSCGEMCSQNHLQMILHFLNSAKYSISLCMYMLTLIDLQDALINAHNRGIMVRYISDIEMLNTVAARKDYLKAVGFPIKVQPDWRKLMHHKFCIVDEKYPDNAKMFFGSLNLTHQALTSNWDHVVFITDYEMVKIFHEEFEYLWENFNFV